MQNIIVSHLEAGQIIISSLHILTIEEQQRKRAPGSHQTPFSIFYNPLDRSRAAHLQTVYEQCSDQYSK